MRLSRRRRARAKPQRHLSLSATDAEWAVVSANAERRGLSKARYLMGLVERDAPGTGSGAGGGADRDPPMVLAPDEQRALLDAARAIHALLIGDRTPPAEETAPADAPDPPSQGRLF